VLIKGAHAIKRRNGELSLTEKLYRSTRTSLVHVVRNVPAGVRNDLNFGCSAWVCGRKLEA